MRPRPHTTNAAWNAMPPPSIEPRWLYPEVAEEPGLPDVEQHGAVFRGEPRSPAAGRA